MKLQKVVGDGFVVKWVRSKYSQVLSYILLTRETVITLVCLETALPGAVSICVKACHRERVDSIGSMNGGVLTC